MSLICDICQTRKEEFRAWREWIICRSCECSPEGQHAIRLRAEAASAMGAWAEARRNSPLPDRTERRES